MMTFPLLGSTLFALLRIGHMSRPRIAALRLAVSRSAVQPVKINLAEHMRSYDSRA